MIERHEVSVIDGKVNCPCGFIFKSKDADLARRWAHAHVSNPHATAAQIHEFVCAEKERS